MVPVDDEGRYTAEVPDFVGQNVFDANPERDHAMLKEREGRIVRHETYDHNYPHCWRTDTPIIYKAINVLVCRGSPPSDRSVAGRSTTRSTGFPTMFATASFGKWLEGRTGTGR